MTFIIVAAGFTLCGCALLLTWQVIRVTDFGAYYRLVHENSLRMYRTYVNHPVVVKAIDMNAFRWSGISVNTILAVQGAIAAISLIAASELKNIFIIIPLFLMIREMFAIIAMLIRGKRTVAENAGLESMLRLFLAEMNQTNSRRESLGRMTETLTGIWRDAVGKLFRSLGGGSNNSEHYAEFARTFPNNRHVRLLSQALSYSDTYGGDIKDTLTQLVQDVMYDRMETEKNKSETSATLYMTLLINCGIAVIAAVNLASSPVLRDILIDATTGKLLLSVAALCCYISLRVTRRIVEE